MPGSLKRSVGQTQNKVAALVEKSCSGYFLKHRFSAEHRFCSIYIEGPL